MKKLIIPIIACLMLLSSCGTDEGSNLEGSWQSDGSTYDYNDGNVYRNGTKLWRYEAGDDGNVRVYDGKNGNDYNDYSYSVGDDSMTLNGQSYTRAQ